MDRVLDIATVVSHEIADYVVSSFNARLFYSENPATNVYTVISVPNDWRKRPHVMLMAQVIDNKVVILSDTTDRPLHEALIRAGIPREHIKLAFQGETLPSSQP